MVVDLTLKKVHKILSDVSPDKAFYLSSGKYIRNLHELFDSLKFMDDEVFRNHVNENQNDLYPWILDVIRDNVLADRIRKETERARFVELIETRIKELESVEQTFTHKHKKEITAAIEDVKKPKKRNDIFTFLLGFFVGLLIGLFLGRLLLTVF